MRAFATIEALADAVGQTLGSSDWLAVDQPMVDAFAACTGDRQWIHVDVDRSAAGPFGGTIAHGFLTLSLIPRLQAEVFSVDTPGPKLNYGCNKVRFPAPLLVGRRVRDTCTLLEVTEIGIGHQTVVRHVLEIEGGDKPACVADTVAVLLPTVTLGRS